MRRFALRNCKRINHSHPAIIVIGRRNGHDQASHLVADRPILKTVLFIAYVDSFVEFDASTGLIILDSFT